MNMMQRTKQRIEKGAGLPVLTIVLLCIFWLPVSAQYIEPTPQPPCPTPYVKTISPRAAQPLTEVKIRGSRFGTEPGSVTFTPGVNGKIISWSIKRIFVEVPEDAQSGQVSVTSSCGSVSSNTQYFTIEGLEEEY